MKTTSHQRFLFILLFLLLHIPAICSQNQKASKNKSEIISIGNKQLSVNINTSGAELWNITAQQTGREYLWQGDPSFWHDRSPILFPVVGRLWKNEYRIDGKQYKMEAHGFAQRYVFDVIAKKENEAWFRLKSDETTSEKYPFRFELIIGYILDGKRLKVVWNVKNTDTRTMPFQIGGHPGFQYPDFDETADCNGYLSFNTIEDEIYFSVKEKNYFFSANPERHRLALNKDGLLPITQQLFKDDSLTFEDYQVRKVTLLDRNKTPYLSMEFEIPVFGLWSLSHKNAPYICIEPWWGKEGKVDTEGEFGQREWTQQLAPSENFVTSYTIEILD
ncbi:aldose 1-epimerase family protein [Dysgonomonas sp. 25]|uniref:aldose 1-epimerase family protein n=1 Tax=Dysgonomonas sp. 25 TaxID=2302933 RepID=UPI0013D7986C|nr:aldose 1-epimerase family protein [Dysgonomonas sp. 25]NDV68824.1 aldose 1-epimerase family protein [Dysgonomonas sp. 25]